MFLINCFENTYWKRTVIDENIHTTYNAQYACLVITTIQAVYTDVRTSNESALIVSVDVRRHQLD